jgi:hypothetical protein
MSGYIAPALVSSKDDLIEYWVKDSEPVRFPSEFQWNNSWNPKHTADYK